MPKRHSFGFDNFTYVPGGSSIRCGIRPPVADVRSQAVVSGSLRYGLIPQAAALGIGWQVHPTLVHH